MCCLAEPVQVSVQSESIKSAVRQAPCLAEPWVKLLKAGPACVVVALDAAPRKMGALKRALARFA